MMRLKPHEHCALARAPRHPQATRIPTPSRLARFWHWLTTTSIEIEI